MAVDREALLRLVLASGEDEARIVFADWLEEQGHGPRATLIQLQCEAAKLGRWDARSLEIGWETEALLAEHADRCRADLPAIDGVTWGDFERGFVSTVRVADLATLVEVAPALQAIAPITRAELVRGGDAMSLELPPPIRAIRMSAAAASLAFRKATRAFAGIETLELTGVEDDELDWLAAQRDARLVHLIAPGGTGTGLAFLRALVKQPWSKALRTLDLASKWVPVDTGYGADPDPRLGAEGGKLLGKLARLERLVIDRQRIASKAFGELFEKLPRLVELSARECGITKLDGLSVPGASLVQLDLSQNALGNAGVLRLAAAPRLAHLQYLALDTCEVESYGLATLAKSPAWQTLRALDLSRNPLGMSGARALAEVPAPSQLASLRLADADFDAVAGNALGKIGWLGQLAVLDLSGNRLAAGATSLRSFAPERLRSLQLRATGLGRSEAAILARFWPTLVHLELGHNAFGDAGIERFAVMKAAPLLQSLGLADCQLTDDGLELLARSRCPRLRHLALAGNAFGARGLDALLRSPAASRLETLDLSRCALDDQAIAVLARATLPALARVALRGNELAAASLVRLADSSTLARVTFELDGAPWSYEPAIRDALAARFGAGWFRVDD